MLNRDPLQRAPATDVLEVLLPHPYFLEDKNLGLKEMVKDALQNVRLSVQTSFMKFRFLLFWLIYHLSYRLERSMSLTQT